MRFDEAPLRTLFIGGTGTISASCVRLAVESGMDVAKLRKTGPPKPPILPGATPEIADGSIGPLVPEPA